MHRALHISLIIQWLWVTVSLRRMESFDFMSILARWTHLKIYCTLMPACRAWLSLHPIGTYLLTTYTYKRMHLLNRVYGTHKVSDYSGWPLSYSDCCCCHSNKIITFVLYSRCKWHLNAHALFLIVQGDYSQWHIVQYSHFLPARHSVCNSLQFFQWRCLQQFLHNSFAERFSSR